MTDADPWRTWRVTGVQGGRVQHLVDSKRSSGLVSWTLCGKVASRANMPRRVKCKECEALRVAALKASLKPQVSDPISEREESSGER